MNTMLFRSLLSLVLLPTFMFASALPLAAQTNDGTIKIGEYGDWLAYRANTTDGWACYIYSEPIKSEIDRSNVRRDPVYLFVANLPDVGLVEDVSATFGYPLKVGVAPTIKVGKQTFEMQGDGDDAIIADPEQNKSLVTVMKRGSSLTITGQSTRGTTTIDTFSLKGVTAGLRAVEDCS